MASDTPLLVVDRVFVDPTTPLVCALDHGITVGDGVFETCEILDGATFAVTRHLERLERSATGIGLEPPTRERVREAIGMVEERWRMEGRGHGRLRITWTAGAGPLGSDRYNSPGTLIVGASSVGEPGPVAVALVEWVRNERSALAGLKTTSYAENVVALAYAKKHGAGEAIFANTRGDLCEGTGTNVFLESDGVLLTPPLSSGCLAGVTRALVLEWAREAGITAREQVLPLSALGEAPHAALTSSTRGITPISAVDGRSLQPGPVTLAMAEVFSRFSRERLDP